MLCGRPLLLEIGSVLWNVNFQSMWELQELVSQSLTNGETGPNEENKSISSPRSTNSESSAGKSSVQNKQVRRAASKMKTRQYTYHLNPKERWDPNPLFLPGHGALQIQHITTSSAGLLLPGEKGRLVCLEMIWWTKSAIVDDESHGDVCTMGVERTMMVLVGGAYYRATSSQPIGNGSYDLTFRRSSAIFQIRGVAWPRKIEHHN